MLEVQRADLGNWVCKVGDFGG